MKNLMLDVDMCQHQLQFKLTLKKNVVEELLKLWLLDVATRVTKGV